MHHSLARDELVLLHHLGHNLRGELAPGVGDDRVLVTVSLEHGSVPRLPGVVLTRVSWQVTAKERFKTR